MAEEQKTIPKQTTTPASLPAPGAPIPVAVLTFEKDINRFPGMRGPQPKLNATPVGKPGAVYTIEFVPQLRHHRVSYIANPQSKPQVVMIHESRVESWEPLS